MKALVLQEYRRFVVKDVPTPTPGNGEVLIRVRSVGICGSDLHGYDGTSGRRIPPIIMGHEAAGEITQTGADVRGWQVGDRVTFDSTIYDLDDWYSLRGWYNLSEGRRVLGVSCDEYRQNGAFAEFVVVPQHILYRLPEALSYDHAALTEPVAVALHGISLTPIEIGDTVAVVGAGVIGLLVVAGLKQRGCANIVVADISDTRLQIARELGATHTVNPTSDVENHAEYCARLTDGRGADSVLEAVGLDATVKDSVRAVRRGGTVTILGNIAQEVSIPLQRVVAGQIRIQGVCAIRAEYDAALHLLTSGAIPAEKLISTTAALEDAPAIFDRLHDGDPALLKVIINP